MALTTRGRRRYLTTTDIIKNSRSTGGDFRRRNPLERIVRGKNPLFLSNILQNFEEAKRENCSGGGEKHSRSRDAE